MEEKVKTFLLWTAIGILCFVGIPIHLKGSENVLLESTFKNYTTHFNKSYNAEQYKEKFHHFKKSMEHIKKLQEQDALLMSSSAVSDDDEQSEGQDQVLKMSLDGNLDSSSSKHHHHHHRKSHNKWKPGMPKNQGVAEWGLTKFADISPDVFQKQYLDPKMLDRILTRQGKKKNASHNKHRNQYSHTDISSNGGGGGEDNQNVDNIEDNSISRKKRAAAATMSNNLPDKVDWRAKGVITPVKHQRFCGACWAFSTIETVESMTAIQKSLPPKSLSVQQVIDCATNGNMGCNGGDTCSALSWMASRKLATESEYPTTLKDGTCRLQNPSTGIQIAANFTCEDLEGTEQKILRYLAHHGPVVTAVDATNWQFYVGGVIQWNCDANNNHAVQVVGYDATATPPHYIVRNSWGPDFGDNGYLYVAIGSNLCGIAREVSTITVK